MLQCDALHDEHEEEEGAFPFFFFVGVLMTHYLLDLSRMSTCVFLDGFQAHANADLQGKEEDIPKRQCLTLFFFFSFFGSLNFVLLLSF